MQYLFPEQKKSPAIQYMETIYKGMQTMASARAKYSDNVKSFGANVLSVVLAATPEIAQQFDQYMELQGELAKINLTLSVTEARASEDIRDLIERYQTVERANMEFINSKDAFNNASNAMIEAIANLTAESKENIDADRKVYLETQVSASKTAKKEALKALKQKIKDLMQIKLAYNAFKRKRLASCWQLYAGGIKEYSAKQTEILQSIAYLIKATKAQGIGTPAIMDATASGAAAASIQMAKAADDIKAAAADAEKEENQQSPAAPAK